MDRLIDDPSRLIHNWQGLTLAQCKSLDASTVGTAAGTLWTYGRHASHCIVQETGYRNTTAKPDSGIISGRGCGTGMSSRLLNFYRAQVQSFLSLKLVHVSLKFM